MDMDLMSMIVEEMFDELDGAKSYCKLAKKFKEHNEHSKAQIFKDIAMAEIGHFETIKKMVDEHLDAEHHTGIYKMIYDRYMNKYHKIKEELTSI